MSESPVRPTSTQLPSPKSMSEYGIKKRLSLDEVVNDSIDPKSSPSNQNFLSSLKTFNIDKSKYRHYGTSMNSHALQSIINESDNHTNSNTKPQQPENVDRRNSYSERRNSENIKSNKFIIDEYISEILSLPKQTIGEESIWPYNITTLHEILKYKVEQEKTKQELIKTEFSNISLEILKLVNNMSLDRNLLPIIFNSSEDSLKLLHLKLNELQHSHGNVSHQPNNSQHEDNKSYTFKKESSIELNKSNPPELSHLKRKNSDTHLPSFSQTTESIRSNIDSPITQSPHEEHRRNKSTSSVSSKGSKHSPIHHHVQLPTPQPLSKISRASPPIQHPLPPNVYQIYYGPPINEPGANGQSTNNLGSPYSAKYPGVIYQPPPPGYVVPQYQYFVPSTPNNEINANNQTPYAVRPSLPLPHPTQQPPVPSHQFQSNDKDSSKSNIFRSAEIHEDNITTTKRHKSIGKSTSINFMITTPKNPPARKYNNPSKDK